MRRVFYILLLVLLMASLIAPLGMARPVPRISEKPLTSISYPAVNFTIYPYFLKAESNGTVMYVLLKWYPFIPTYQWWTRQGNNVYVYYEYTNTFYGLDIQAKITYHFMDPGLVKISVAFKSNKPATKYNPYMLYMISYAVDRSGKKITMHMHRHGHIRGWDKPTTAVAGKVFFDWSDMIRAGMKPVLNVTTSYASIIALTVNWTETTKYIDPTIGVLNGAEPVNATLIYYPDYGIVDQNSEFNDGVLYPWVWNGLYLGTYSVGYYYFKDGQLAINYTYVPTGYVQLIYQDINKPIYKVEANFSVINSSLLTCYVKLVLDLSNGTQLTLFDAVPIVWLTATTYQPWRSVTVTFDKPVNVTRVEVLGSTTVKYNTIGIDYIRLYGTTLDPITVNITGVKKYTIYSVDNATYTYTFNYTTPVNTAYPPKIILDNIPSGYELTGIDNTTLESYTINNNGLTKNITMSINTSVLTPIYTVINITSPLTTTAYNITVPITIPSTWAGWNYPSLTNNTIYLLDSSGKPHYIDGVLIPGQDNTIYANLTLQPGTNLFYLYWNDTAGQYLAYHNPYKTYILYDPGNSLQGWYNYSLGAITLGTDPVTGQTVLHKIANNDPNGGYKILPVNLLRQPGINIILQAMIYRPSTFTGGGYDRIGLINSTGYGYGFAFGHDTTNNVAYVGVDVRAGYTPTITQATVNTLNLNAWYYAEMIINDTGIKAIAYTSSGIIGQESILSSTYNNFTEFYIFGGYDYYVKDIKVYYQIPDLKINTFDVASGTITLNFTAWNTMTYLDTNNSYRYYNPGSIIPLSARLVDPFGNPINGTNITYIVYINGTKAQEFNVTTDTYGWSNTTLALPSTPNTRIDIETIYNGSYLGLKNITLYTTGVVIQTNISSLPDILIPGHTYIITGHAYMTVNNYTIPLMINGSGQIFYYTPTPGGYKNITFTLWSYYQGVNVTRTVTITRLVGDMINATDVEFTGTGGVIVKYITRYTGLKGYFSAMNWTTNGTIAYSPSISWILNQTVKLNIYKVPVWVGQIMAWADNHTMSISVDNTNHKITIVVNGPCTLKVYVGDLGAPRQVIYDYKVFTGWSYNATSKTVIIPITGTIVTLDYSSLVSVGGGGGGIGVPVLPQNVDNNNNAGSGNSHVNVEPIAPKPNPNLAGLMVIVLSIVATLGYYNYRQKQKKLSYHWEKKLSAPKGLDKEIRKLWRKKEKELQWD